jgi:hypothetical protein
MASISFLSTHLFALDASVASTASRVVRPCLLLPAAPPLLRRIASVWLPVLLLAPADCIR